MNPKLSRSHIPLSKEFYDCIHNDPYPDLKRAILAARMAVFTMMNENRSMEIEGHLMIALLLLDMDQKDFIRQSERLKEDEDKYRPWIGEAAQECDRVIALDFARWKSMGSPKFVDESDKHDA